MSVRRVQPRAKYRDALPQLGGGLYITDAGLETMLIQDGIDLPCFAAFDLMKTTPGIVRLYDYYARFARLAVAQGAGLVLEGVTWRANADWGARLGYDAAGLAEMNRRAVDLMLDVRRDFETAASPMPISGNIGPRGDGYDPGALMTPQEAEDYHGAQVAVLAGTLVDCVSAFTLTHAAEAIGIVRAARRGDVPVVISFTLGTDGRLPTGQPLGEAIAEVDAKTGAYAAHFMINCAHPTHFADTLDPAAAWTQRLRGLRANASSRSPAELDAAGGPDTGNPAELGRQYAELRRCFPQLNVLGGCCGTDLRHVEAIAATCCGRAA
jgi:S-methylmethionine-dependent homocysteine/selenocysteine methylase